MNTLHIIEIWEVRADTGEKVVKVGTALDYKSAYAILEQCQRPYIELFDQKSGRLLSRMESTTEYRLRQRGLDTLPYGWS